MRCDENGLIHQHIIVFGFQSLSGFLMRCDTLIKSSSPLPRTTFQSLSGFLMRCDNGQYNRRPYLRLVSIPIGFSDAL